MKGFIFALLAVCSYQLSAGVRLASADDSVTSGFFDKNAINESMVGDSFAERKHTAPRTVQKTDAFSAYSASEMHNARQRAATSLSNKKSEPHRTPEPLLTPGIGGQFPAA